MTVDRGKAPCKIGSAGALSGAALELIMARNFGLHRSTNNDRAPICPLLVMTLIIVGVINAAAFLPHH
ncbi:hypothetical protein [Bradyrhizobium sp. CCBAU 11434]|uniref:hypothetical protein n=1 Tax=Bradyrhizobium sp. CCBAU 11434 TaxID=1630885 RepID=UPI002305A3CB|nr:hypothetical protein [Bradyrhizobium sp. CCBAU 11434]